MPNRWSPGCGCCDAGEDCGCSLCDPYSNLPAANFASVRVSLGGGFCGNTVVANSTQDLLLDGYFNCDNVNTNTVSCSYSSSTPWSCKQDVGGTCYTLNGVVNVRLYDCYPSLGRPTACTSGSPTTGFTSANTGNCGVHILLTASSLAGSVHRRIHAFKHIGNTAPFECADFNQANAGAFTIWADDTYTGADPSCIFGGGCTCVNATEPLTSVSMV